MEQLRRIALCILIVFCACSVHVIWLMNRVHHACGEALQAQPGKHELLGAQRICSAAGVDTMPMLKVIFPQTPRQKSTP